MAALHVSAWRAPFSGRITGRWIHTYMGTNMAQDCPAYPAVPSPPPLLAPAGALL